MSTTGQSTLEDKFNRLRRGSPREILKLVDVMYVTAERVFYGAIREAEGLKHAEAGNAHLLAAMLGMDSSESASGVPETLRQAGLDYKEVHGILESKTDLEGRGRGDGMPRPSEGLTLTLGAALERCKVREGRHHSYGAIITADMAIALLFAATTDPLLREVFEEAEVNIAELRKALRAATADQPQVPMLIGVD